MAISLLVLGSTALLTPPSAEPRFRLAESSSRRQAVVGLGAMAVSALAPNAALADAPKTPKFFSTEGGVKYFDLEEGKCALFNVACSPQQGDLVKIKYKAYLSNGKMFDSSEGPGRKPLAAKYKTGQLLPGWEEALETMKEGGTRVIQVPPALAYGEKGIKIETKDGSTEYLVPPNEKLQYELTLVQVAVPPP